MLDKVQGFMDSFTTLESTSRSGVSNAKLSAPVLKAHRLTVDGKDEAIPSVADLLFTGGPRAIIRAVTGVVVNSLDGEEGRFFYSHIQDKTLKRISPPIADGYSSLAVIMKGLAAWVGASIVHRLPAFVLRSSRHSVSGSLLIFNAAARLNSILFKVIGSNIGILTTLAKASPVSLILAALGLTNNCKPPVGMSGSIFKIVGSHNMSLKGLSNA